jgi:hypothetical protein
MNLASTKIWRTRRVNNLQAFVSPFFILMEQVMFERYPRNKEENL